MLLLTVRSKGRWWFGNREKTKDGIHSRSAAAFFKGLSEESGIDEVTSSLGKAFEWDLPKSKLGKADAELVELENKIKEKLNGKWDELVKLAEATPKAHAKRRRAFILLYAHLLRLPVQNPTLQKGMRKRSLGMIQSLMHIQSKLRLSSKLRRCSTPC